jgi:hypothetical protein
LSPVAAVDAVAREPLATMKALVERMNAPPDTPDAAGAQETPATEHTPQAAPADAIGHLPPGLAAALAQAAALAPGLAATLESALPTALQAAQAEAAATAQAQQGRMTLGQMAQQSQMTQVQAESATLPMAATHLSSETTQQSLASPQGSSAHNTPAAAATVLSTPVWMAPLQAPASPQTQRHAAVQPESARQQGGQQQGSDDEPESDGERQHEPTQALAADAEAQNERQSQPQSDAQSDAQSEARADASRRQSRAVLDAVSQHASAEVQRELQAGRRVLVVLPHDEAGRGLVPAQAALLGPSGVRFFESARWWPGDVVAATKDAVGKDAAWPQWRVFREGDPLRAPLLVSRADGHACRVLLGTPAPQVLDSHAATLELPERLRFVQALGGQWSLLLVVAPAQVDLGERA